MGTTASTNVKTITINQDDEKWERLRNRDSEVSSASSARRPLSGVSERIRKSAGSIASRTSLEKERRCQQLHSQVEAAETRLAQAEATISTLQRELSTSELRCHELSTEVSWLRDQVGAQRPELIEEILEPPKPTEAPCSELSELRNRIRTLEHELKTARLESIGLEGANAGACASSAQKDLQIARLEKENREAKLRITSLEELLRVHMSGAHHVNGYFKNTRPAVVHEPSAAQNEARRSSISSEDDKEEPSKEDIMRATKVRRNSNTSQISFNATISHERKRSEKVVDDIEALLESPEADDETSSSSTTAADEAVAHNTVAHVVKTVQDLNLTLRNGDLTKALATTESLKKANGHLVNPVRPRPREDRLHIRVCSQQSKRPNGELRNVFALSEAMEPVRIGGDDTPLGTARPSTAQSTFKTHPPDLARNASVPVLFRRSQPVHNDAREPSTEEDLASVIDYETSQTADNTDSDIGDVDDILNISVPSLSSKTDTRRKRSTSGKSRDSGYHGTTHSLRGENI